MKIEVKPVMCIDLPKDIFCETVRVCNAPKLTKIIAEHIKAEREAKKDNEDNH
jgi:hypothetical protein